jgi:diguanylate cyclase (GGDEF)-like protein/PAS domain S-box-containing protein
MVVPSSKIRISLIEDNLAEAELLRDMLVLVRGFAYQIIHHCCLSDGIDYLLNNRSGDDPADVVLLDLNLPDSSGFETFEHFFRQIPWMPTILLTNMDDEEMALRAVRQGAQDYLVKTELDVNLLARVIRYAIERKRVEGELRESEERYTLAIQGANDGLWDWVLDSNHIYFSPRWKEMLGYLPDEIVDRPDEWLNRIHPDDIQDVQLALSAHLEGLHTHFENEHRLQRKDGSYIWVLIRGVAVRDKKGKPYRMAGSLSDISIRKQTEERLLYDALHDALTGLPNRTMFMDRLGHAVKRFKRNHDSRFAVLFLDLDRFKVINDSLGHPFGDQLLKIVANSLTKCLRTSDSAARLGGDEFAILLEDISSISDAVVISERIQQTLQNPFEFKEHKVVISTSIGIVLSDTKYEIPEDILRDADIAMYHAKLLGKACHVLFNPTMRNRAVMRMELENDLRQVLVDEKSRNKELRVVFQPIVALQGGQILGFEALLRWFHPDRGVIMPNEFIPMAEETGLIHSLGLWVLRKACQQVRIWHAQNNNGAGNSPISVSVNISGKQFSRPDLVDQIEKILHDNAIAPSCLNLEITESLLVESDKPLIAALERLRNLGINLQVDDFGRGYSSFSYLQHLPVNTLKIDSLFIHRMEINGNNSEIVRSIVSLARSLGMSVIAEGVETDRQFQKLKSLDCEFGQGFYISKPVSGVEAGNLILQNRQQVVS